MSNSKFDLPLVIHRVEIIEWLDSTDRKTGSELFHQIVHMSDSLPLGLHYTPCSSATDVTNRLKKNQMTQTLRTFR